MEDKFTLEKLKIDERLRGVEVHMAGSVEVLKYIKEGIDSLNVKVGIQNGRVSKLEHDRAYVMGGCAVIGAIVGVIFKHL